MAAPWQGSALGEAPDVGMGDAHGFWEYCGEAGYCGSVLLLMGMSQRWKSECSLQ